jgi:hypothetical protein
MLKDGRKYVFHWSSQALNEFRSEAPYVYKQDILGIAWEEFILCHLKILK